MEIGFIIGFILSGILCIIFSFLLIFRSKNFAKKEAKHFRNRYNIASSKLEEMELKDTRIISFLMRPLDHSDKRFHSDYIISGIVFFVLGNFLIIFGILTALF